MSSPQRGDHSFTTLMDIMAEWHSDHDDMLDFLYGKRTKVKESIPSDIGKQKDTNVISDVAIITISELSRAGESEGDGYPPLGGDIHNPPLSLTCREGRVATLLSPSNRVAIIDTGYIPGPEEQAELDAVWQSIQDGMAAERAAIQQERERVRSVVLAWAERRRAIAPPVAKRPSRLAFLGLVQYESDTQGAVQGAAFHGAWTGIGLPAG